MDIDLTLEWRKNRLIALVEKFGGRAELGRAAGFRDGAYIRQMIDGERPITEKTVGKFEQLKGCSGWFAKNAAGEVAPTPIVQSSMPMSEALDTLIYACSGLGIEKRRNLAQMIGALVLNPGPVIKDDILEIIGTAAAPNDTPLARKKA